MKTCSVTGEICPVIDGYEAVVSILEDVPPFFNRIVVACERGILAQDPVLKDEYFKMIKRIINVRLGLENGKT